MSVGIAILGGGIFVKEAHLPAIQSAPDLFSLKALYSRSLKTAKDVSSGVDNIELYSDESEQGNTLDDLLKRSDVQAVIIALPILIQPDIIKRCLSAGKHVLAEKPMAKDRETAQELLDWYRSAKLDMTLNIAENARFWPNCVYASEQIAELGKLIWFGCRNHSNVEKGNKYFETPWRKQPDYQGGFLLDGGIHTIAMIRSILGKNNAITKVSALTRQIQEHLPPIDTFDAVMITNSGVTGTFSMSFGMPHRSVCHTFICENGKLEVFDKKIVVTKGGQENTKTFSGDMSGVNEEITAWGKAIISGQKNEAAEPEEAYADLELLQMIFDSGNSGGAPFESASKTS